jgi:proteasome lid subunit RPN8/RPN11
LLPHDAVRVRVSVLDAIAAHAKRIAPYECCGLLVGGGNRVEQAWAVDNRAADPLRGYEVDPRDYIAANRRCRGSPSAVVGAYHSHPRSAAEPSPRDVAEAFCDFLYLIAGPVGGSEPVEIKAYRFIQGNFYPLPLVPDAEEPQT